MFEIEKFPAGYSTYYGKMIRLCQSAADNAQAARRANNRGNQEEHLTYKRILNDQIEEIKKYQALGKSEGWTQLTIKRRPEQ